MPEIPPSPEVRLEELRKKNGREVQLRANDPSVGAAMMQIRAYYGQRLLETLVAHHLGMDALTTVQIEIEEMTEKVLNDMQAAQVRASLLAPANGSGPGPGFGR